MPPEAVEQQIKAVCDDIGVQAAKTGMLLNQEIITTVVKQIETLQIPNLVVDPGDGVRARERN